MIDPIRLAPHQQFLINLAAIAFIVTFTEIAAATTIADQAKLFSEQNEGTHRFYFVLVLYSYFQVYLLFVALSLGINPKLVLDLKMGMKF